MPLLLALALLAQGNPVQVQSVTYPRADVAVTADGYLMVLGSDEKGRPHVIYPRHPAQDGRVAAGTTVSVEGRHVTTWLAVWSDRPNDATRFTANTFWSRDSLWGATRERGVDGLLDVARQLSATGSLEAYDLADAAPPSGIARRPARTSVDLRGLKPDFYSSEFYRWKEVQGSPPIVCSGGVCAIPAMRQLVPIIYRRF